VIVVFFDGCFGVLVTHHIVVILLFFIFWYTVITMPGGYHFGINLGFNVAEATNFAVPEWVPKGREANICMCRPHSVHIDMDGFEALLKRYNEDMLHAEKLGMRKKSYREWILLDTEGQNKQSLVSEGQGGGRMGMGGGGTKKADPNLEKAKKNGRWFWVEVAKPAADGRQPSKKKQKRPMVQDDNDWRLAQPVSKIDMLKLGAKVLCLLRSKDAHGNEMDDELCFAGEIIELDEGCVKVHFEGMLRKEDAWINFNSEKVFLDTGHRYYTEEGLPNMNIKLPKDQSLELLGE
jgi:jumonji domain-containing protein 2